MLFRSRLWLGADFAREGTAVLQLLSIGVLANTMAQAPANLIQARGQPKWMAIVHLLELPFFLLAIWYLTGRFGIAGTALAWSSRTIIDCAILFALAGGRVSGSDIAAGRAVLTLGLAGALCAAGFLARSNGESTIVCALGLAGFVTFAWLVILTNADKARLLRFAGGKRSTSH